MKAVHGKFIKTLLLMPRRVQPHTSEFLTVDNNS